MRITDLLASNGYILYNIAIARELGINESILLGELAKEFNYWDSIGETEDGWFYSTVENVERATGLTGRQQRPTIQHLVDEGMLETKNKGIPCKRYFKINESNILHFVDCNSDILLKQLPTKGNKNNKENNSNNNKPKYKRPTLEEVNQYINEKGLSVDGNKFFTYFEEGNWIDSRGNPVRNWKQKLLTWENKNDRRTNADSTGERNRTGQYGCQTTSYDRRNRNGNSDPESIRRCVKAIESAFESEVDWDTL